MTAVISERSTSSEVPQQSAAARSDVDSIDLTSNNPWVLLGALPSGHPERQRARDGLVAEHLPLVRYLAARYRNRGENLEDLIQVGSIGLIKSIDRFDPDRGVAFSSFATPTILGEIKRHFRDKTWMVRVPRSLQELRAPITNAREALSQELHRSPTVPEIAEHLGLDEDQVIEALDAASAYSAESIDTPVSDERSVSRVVESRMSGLDPSMDLVEMRECVTPLLDELPERERRIIFLRFFRELTQAEIAQELGVSQMHISRLLAQTLERMRTKLAAQLADDQAA